MPPGSVSPPTCNPIAIGHRFTQIQICLTFGKAARKCPGMSEPTDKPIIPRPGPVQRRQILVQRNPLPTVNRMLSDAYQTLGSQLAKYRALAEAETFDVKHATAFNKLVTSLTTLQDTERRNVELLKLGQLSEAELQALASQASDIIKPKG